MAKTLVAYFSAEGTTAELAKLIAQKSESDLFEIAPKEPYTKADINYKNPLSRCNKEKIGKKDVPLAKKCESIADYDKIYLGFPIWYWNAPNIVYTFFKEHDLSGKTVVVFATSGGSEFGKTILHIKEALGQSTNVVEGLVIRQPGEVDKLISL